MAFNSTNLSVLAYANGFTLWHYVTHESISEMTLPNYFGGGSDLLRTGDMLMVNADGGSAGAMLLVTQDQPGKITVSKMAVTQPNPISED